MNIARRLLGLLWFAGALALGVNTAQAHPHVWITATSELIYAPDGAVLDSALETADLIVGNSPFGVRMTKEVMWSQLEIGSLQAGIDLENRTQVLSSFTGDLTEAMAAFAEKRPARFTDE